MPHRPLLLIVVVLLCCSVNSEAFCVKRHAGMIGSPYKAGLRGVARRWVESLRRARCAGAALDSFLVRAIL